MKLISMKTPVKKTLKGANRAIAAIDQPEEQPKYPWGLEIALNGESIKKLNLDLENLAAGDKVYFLAQAEITRLSKNESIDEMTGKTRDHSEAGLQIQKMSMGRPGKDF